MSKIVNDGRPSLYTLEELTKICLDEYPKVSDDIADFLIWLGEREQK